VDQPVRHNYIAGSDFYVIRQVAGYVVERGDLLSGVATMHEFFGPLAFAVGFLAFWFVMNKWLLPRFGVRT